MPQLEDDLREAVEVENDDLRERIKQLEGMLGMTLESPLEFNLSASEARLFGLLYKASGILTKERILFAMYTGRLKDEPEQKIVDVFVCKMRKKIERFGIQIETIWGRGYMMPAESKKIVKQYLEPEVEAEVA